jgi:AraC family transcriptional regulator
MDCMKRNEPLERALALIERRLFEPIAFSDVAAESGLSPYHFSRLFTAITGESVMVYVRRRRLVGAAARLLVEPDLGLVDLAFDCGFESQQAFTRAFTRLFGVAPGRFRRAPHPLREQGANPMSETVDLAQLDGVQHRDAFRVAGLSGRYDGQTRSAIPVLWDRLIPRLPVAGQKGGRSYGVCWSGDLEQGIDYMAGVELEAGAPQPEGLEVKEMPAQDYAVFRLTLSGAELHPQLAAAMAQIWGERLQSSGLTLSGGPDFEFYPDDFDARRKGSWLEVWVPVKA